MRRSGRGARLSERVAPVALLVAAVVLIGTVAGGLVARSVLDDEDPASDDAQVAAALAASGLGDDELRCVLAVLAADDPLGDAPLPACAGLASTASTTSTTAGPLPGCTGTAGADPAAVEVCAVDALIAELRRGADLDPLTAACAADAVVDAIGADAVVLAIETGTLPAELRARLQEAFAASATGEPGAPP